MPTLKKPKSPPKQVDPSEAAAKLAETTKELLAKMEAERLKRDEALNAKAKK